MADNGEKREMDKGLDVRARRIGWPLMIYDDCSVRKNSDTDEVFLSGSFMYWYGRMMRLCRVIWFNY